MKALFFILVSVGVVGILATSAQEVKSPENCRTVFDSLHARHVYQMVDTMPEFPGGDDAMLEFIRRNLKWPHYACGEGTVYVSFIIEVDGKATDIKIKKSTFWPGNEEALAVVKKMPHWFPGYCSGQPVPVQMMIPLRFRIE